MNFLKASCKIRAIWFRLFGSFLRCRDRLSLQEDEDQEEVTGSLLSGGAAGGGDDASNQEEQACPHLLPVSPVPHRHQSSLHSINLSVQQVGPRDDNDAGTADQHITNTCPPVCPPVCPGDPARCLRKRRQWKDLTDLQYLRTGEMTCYVDTVASCEVTSCSANSCLVC